jgi:hypothetical protein
LGRYKIVRRHAALVTTGSLGSGSW